MGVESWRRLDETTWASPQVGTADLEGAAADGFALVINNRPDGEDAGQPDGAEIEQAARALGLDYVAIPVSGPPGPEQVEAMRQALDAADGRVLAYCRSGGRSAALWGLARA